MARCFMKQSAGTYYNLKVEALCDLRDTTSFYTFISLITASRDNGI